MLKNRGEFYIRDLEKHKPEIHISVIIPVYNVEQYLAQCLNSVLGQSFKSFEVICVNDKSKDDSLSILKEYVKKDNRIQLVEHEENKGLSATRNTGLKKAQGKYVFFLDSDDMIDAKALEELFAFAEDNQTDIVYFNMMRIWERENEKYKNLEQKIKSDIEFSRVYNGQELFALFVENNTLKIEAWRQFYKREFLIENNLWFYEGILHEDNLFSFLCAMKARKVANINKNYYIYRQRENSIMSNKNKLRAQSMFIVFIELFQYWNSNKFSERSNNAIEKYLYSVYQAYLTYKPWDEFDEDISVGSTAEKFLYSLIRNKKNKYGTLSEDKISIIKQYSMVIVYGAGKASEEIIQVLHDNNISIYGVAVSSMKNNPSSFCRIKVNEIQNFIEYKTRAVIIISVTKKYSSDIFYSLKEMEFENVIEMDEI